MSGIARFAAAAALLGAALAVAHSHRSRTAAIEPVTFHGQIERIFQREC